VVEFEGRRATYPFDQLEQLELAYAVTVHKSQGSEFQVVVMPLVGGFPKLCYRNLLYTAVTRARKLLVMVGSQKVIYQMVDNNRRTRRYTFLIDMLKEAEERNK
jgi:exodeoxyribonuclease V alpha subunit